MEDVSDGDEPADSTSSDKDGDEVVLQFSRKEFENLIQEKLYRQKDLKKHATARTYKVLVPGAWQAAITMQLWNIYRIACGFAFQRGRVTETNTASFEGILEFLFTYMLLIKIGLLMKGLNGLHVSINIL